MKKIKAFLLALALVITLLPANMVQAAGITDITSFKDYYSTEGFAYKVRIYAGSQGLFANGTDEYVTYVQPGITLNFQEMLNMKLYDDSKYYVRGLRESGKDNDTVKGWAFTVNEDLDLVVAYGLQGGDIEYTIEYVDAEGNELAPAEKHYGNDGDKPVVAFKYITGYVPQAYNLTKTLKAGESNVFRFVYTPGNAGNYIYTIGDDGTIIVYRDGGETVTYTPGQIIDEGTIGGGVTVITQGGGGAGGDGGANIPDEAVPEAGPRDLVDLDDGEVPLAGGEGFGLPFEYIDDPATALAFSQMPASIIAIIVLSFVALLAVIGFIV